MKNGIRDHKKALCNEQKLTLTLLGQMEAGTEPFPEQRTRKRGELKWTQRYVKMLDQAA
jgi:hypothetical protein